MCLYKEESHKKLYRFKFLSFLVIERNYTNPGSQFGYRQTCLTRKVIFVDIIFLYNYLK
ncbi:hypothetical protein HanRHA438_Chr12g0554461 [Helianthus annuus]|nr:hypothetical protein HanRHA438_Chr12g0554461 [Helianthus annuus]